MYCTAYNLAKGNLLNIMNEKIIKKFFEWHESSIEIVTEIYANKELKKKT